MKPNKPITQIPFDYRNPEHVKMLKDACKAQSGPFDCMDIRHTIAENNAGQTFDYHPLASYLGFMADRKDTVKYCYLQTGEFTEYELLP